MVAEKTQARQRCDNSAIQPLSYRKTLKTASFSENLWQMWQKALHEILIT
jgi:hypothetical protein